MTPSKLLCCLALVACRPQPPQTIEVADNLPSAIVDAAHQARNSWCAVSDVTHWCPDIVENGGDAYISLHALPRKVRAHNNGYRIEVDPDVLSSQAWNLEGVLTHEFGHFGIEGEVPGSKLMVGQWPTPLDIPWIVDPEAVKAWCAQQDSCY